MEIIRQLLDLLPDPAERQALLAHSQFQVTFLLDYLTVFLRAVSGALSGSRSRVAHGRGGDRFRRD